MNSLATALELSRHTDSTEVLLVDRRKSIDVDLTARGDNVVHHAFRQRSRCNATASEGD